MITIENDGERLIATNYFESEHARRGYLYVSSNAGALRILVPRASRGWLDEMRTAEYLIATRGMWTPEPTRMPGGVLRQQHPREALELLFEDGSDSPFAVHVLAEQCDRLPTREDEGRADLRCLVYSEGPTLEMGISARYRRASRLPYLKPWAAR